jgi:predicted secreted Zn-dependent protease
MQALKKQIYALTLLSLLFLVLNPLSSFSQETTLKRIKLTWNAFTSVEKSDLPYIAYTTHKTLYKYKAKQVGAGIKLEFIVDVMLDLPKTKVDISRLNKLDATLKQDLLHHEQGHSDLAVIYGRELLKRLKAASYTIKNYQTKTRSIYMEVMKELYDFNTKYDLETEHGDNAEQQVKWDQTFRERLAI